ncbi:MAG TPA: hypothetical protein VMU04_19380 [Candidatus Acidoferrum sp.]|nr:hypothetical protein [Candidatus Acidoferrum sp.]
MKRLLLLIVLSALSIPPARATTTNFINNDVLGYVYPPQIAPQLDVSNFVNNSIFNVTNIVPTGSPIPLPYETYNTRNWTNANRMSGDSGWRFDYFNSVHQTNGWSANFQNAGNVNPTNAVIFGSDYVLISATNVVNRGTLAISGPGLLNVSGANVDMTRSSFLGTGNETNDLANVLDSYWGVDGIGFYSNVFDTIFVPDYFYTPTQTVQTISYLPAPPHYSYFQQSLLLTNSTPQQPAGYTSYLVIYPDDFNPFLTHTEVLFLSQTNPLITAEVRFRPSYAFTGGAFPNGPYWFQNVKVVQFQSVLTNRMTGAVSTNLLYLSDTNEISVNGFQVTASPVLVQTVRPYLPLFIAATYRPSNYGITHNYPNYANGTLVPATTLDFFNTFAIWNLLIEHWSTSYGALITPNPFSFDPSVSGATFTNMPGRIQIAATKVLTLERVLMDGESYFSVTSTNHFIGSTNAQIIAPFSDINLATTNGVLRIANLIQPTVPRMCGEIDLWSGFWETHLTPPSPASATSNLFHVTVVDSHLQQQVPALVQNLTLHGDNLYISDALNVFGNLLIDAQRLTITTNAANAPTPNGELNLITNVLTWSANLPRLAYVTNCGKISSVGSVYFGGARTPPWFSGTYDEPYQSFVTHGLIQVQGESVWANYFEASGTNNSGVGPVSLQASAAIITNGVFLATDADITLTAGSLLISNQVLQAGRSITMTVTNYLDDGSVNTSVDLITNQNIWTVGGGINLLDLPAQASLLATTVTNTAYLNAEVDNYWAGNDYGVSPAGFVNNAALGRLILDGQDSGSLFAFLPTGQANALYVDLLELKDATINVDSEGKLVGVYMPANFNIYYGGAVWNGKDISEQINGRYGFAGPSGGQFFWVSNYNTGFFSSTNVIYTDGSGMHQLNRALVASCDIDSNGNGIPNCMDPNPIPVFSAASLGLKVAYTNRPSGAVVVSWNTIPSTTNYLYGSSPKLGKANTWQLLTNFVSGPQLGARASVTDTSVKTNSARFYRVQVVSP